VPRQRIDLEAVLIAAAAAVDATGLEALSLSGLARDLGVRPSALYNHVAGLDGLRHELAVHATENLARHLRDSVVARSGGDAVEAIAAAYREFAHRHPGQFAASMLPPVDAQDQLLASHEMIVDLFITIVKTLGPEGEAAVHWARLLRSTVHGFVSLEAIEALTNPVDRNTSFRELVTLTIAALES
jgi:AcrR family transcriptional regulator